MPRKRYTEEQIIAVLNEAEAGAGTGELCRKHGMSEAALHLPISPLLPPARLCNRPVLGRDAPWARCGIVLLSTYSPSLAGYTSRKP